MELYLQFGYGMKSHCEEMAKKWNGATTILSPRDMKPSQLLSWMLDFKKNNVSCLFDPQCYCPKSELKNLMQYDYWDSNFNTYLDNSHYAENQMSKIKYYNDIAETEYFIVPSVLYEFSEIWEELFTKKSKRLIKATRNIILDKPILATLTLPAHF